MFEVKVLYDMDKGEVNFNSPSPESGYYASSPDSVVAMSPEYIGNIQASSYETNFNSNSYIPGVSLATPKTPQAFFRFRYESEMHGTHGSLMGKDSSREVKTFPSVQLLGVERLKPSNPTIRIRCTLYQADRKNDELPHSHKLVIKNGDHEKYDPHFIDANDNNGYTVEFKGMGIIHTAKKDIITELGRKLIRMKEFELERELTPFEQEKEFTKVKKVNVKSMNLNQVCLCFEAFCYDRFQSRWFKICPAMFSEPINNIKSALTGELKICNYSTCVSSVTGGQEVYLLVEKVNRGDIKVRFFDNDGWVDFARVDTVHHQYAIVMRTPPYKNPSITHPVQVWFQLYRTKDGCTSMSREFTYKPSDAGGSLYEPGQKRKIRRVDEPIIPTVVGEPIVVSSTTTFEDDIEKIDFEGFNLNIPLSPEENQMVQMIREELENSSNHELGQSPCSQIEYDSVSVDEQPSKQEQALMEKMHVFHELLVRCIKKGESESFAKVLALVKNHNLLDNLLRIRYGTQNMTIIHLCCVYGQTTFLRTLIESVPDTDLTMVDRAGNNPLHVCVESGQTDCLKVLLRYKSKVGLELKNYSGLTPLHLAVKYGFIDMTKLLFEQGASLFSVESQTFDTVLHTAVEQKSTEIVKYILENTGTQLLNKLNGSDKSPLDLLYDSSQKFDKREQDIARYLLSNGGWSSHINETEVNSDVDQFEDVDEDDDDVTPVNEVDEKVYSLPSSFQDLTITKTPPENPIKFDALARDQLCTILNTTESWRQCATLLDLENLCDIWGRQDNPSECLLAYIEGCKFELQSVIDTLQSLELSDAISVLDGMVARSLS